jgi:hypothetical protein
MHNQIKQTDFDGDFGIMLLRMKHGFLREKTIEPNEVCDGRQF